MYRSAAAIFVVSLLLAGGAAADVWYVRPDSTGAAVTIQAGIDSCAAGDTVLVAPGIFRGEGNRDIDFRGKAILVIAYRRFDTRCTDATIIDCEGTNTASYHRGFHFHSGETSASILDGFVIENGYGDWYGGGAYCDSSSSPTMRFNTFQYCIANFGSSIGITCSSPIIENNTFYGNGSVKASGTTIECELSSAIIRHNLICSNIAGSGAMSMVENNAASPMISCNYGAILCHSCSLVTIEDNDIIHNNFGAIGLLSSSALIHNNRINDNGAGECSSAGGIGCHHSSAIITNNEIAGNYSWYVSGVGAYDSSVLLENNYIHHNWDGLGLGPCRIVEASGPVCIIRNNVFSENRKCSAIISCSSDSLEITNNTIMNNSLYSDMYDSGAIVCRSPHSIITENVIALNRIGSEPELYPFSALSCISSSPLIENNTIARNEFINGYGIFVDGNSFPKINNNIVCDNLISEECSYICCAGGIYVADSTAALSCNDVFNNESADYAGIPDQTGLNGNISLDPLFCDPENGAFTLYYGSPCLPENHPGGEGCGLIGALKEGCDHVAALHNTNPEPHPMLHQNYPNPFNPTTTIRYYLPERRPVHLGIYNIAGALVASLENGEREEGFHEARWNGTDRSGRPAASGVYFCRLTVGNEKLSRKVLLLR